MDTLLGYHRGVGQQLLDTAIEIVLETAGLMTEQLIDHKDAQEDCQEIWFGNIDQLLKAHLLILAGMEVGDFKFEDDARIDIAAGNLHLLLSSAKGGANKLISNSQLSIVLEEVKGHYDLLIDQIYHKDICDEEISLSLRNLGLGQLICLWVDANIEAMQQNVIRFPYYVVSHVQFLFQLARKYSDWKVSDVDELAERVVQDSLDYLNLDFRDFWFPLEDPHSSIGRLQKDARKQAALDLIDQVEEFLARALSEKAERN